MSFHAHAFLNSQKYRLSRHFRSCIFYETSFEIEFRSQLFLFLLRSFLAMLTKKSNLTLITQYQQPKVFEDFTEIQYSSLNRIENSLDWIFRFQIKDNNNLQP